MRGLYIHIPFCVKKCAYCDFYSLPSRNHLIPAYIDALLSEAETCRGMPFETLYIGGGTPSLMGAPGIKKLAGGLRKIFDLKKITEATVEVNPESATPEFFKTASECGINRISIGVQSLCDAELKSVGRIHKAIQAMEAISNAGEAGFSEISADVIIGLPGQSWESLSRTLEKLISPGITHLSMYCLSLEEGTPLAENPPENLPSEDTQADLFEKARDLLLNSGLSHYEISNFALPGHECRHNLNYWRGGEYLGLGPAAASHIGGRRFKNKGDLDAYLTEPMEQVMDIEELKPSEKAAEEAMLLLRLVQEGLNIEELSGRYGKRNTSRLKKRLEVLAEEGFLDRRETIYRIPSERVLTSNQVLVKVVGE